MNVKKGLSVSISHTFAIYAISTETLTTHTGKRTSCISTVRIVMAIM